MREFPEQVPSSKSFSPPSLLASRLLRATTCASTPRAPSPRRPPASPLRRAAMMRRPVPLTADKVSVLDAVGVEIVAIVAPVSLCMMLCVVLVRLLRVDGDDATANMQGGIASAAYQEQVRWALRCVACSPPLGNLIHI